MMVTVPNREGQMRKAFGGRVKRLRRIIACQKADALLVTDPTNIRYLSGFQGSFALLLVTLKETVFFTDFRYIETVQNSVLADEVVQSSHEYMDDVKREVRKRRIRRLGFESRVLSHAQYLELADKVGAKKLLPLSNAVENLRMVKDEGEIAQIRKAVNLTEKGLRHIQPFLEPGVREKDLVTELEYFFRLNGADEAAFHPIVAFGECSSMPHYASSARKLRESDLVLIDAGASVGGYHADLTRTWLSRNMKGREKEIYDIVLGAQQAAIAGVRPGVFLSSIDGAARQIISASGHGENFGHGLGHGLGLQVHELPRIATRSEGRFRKGMVFTVEPGIYIRGWGGVRIEDDVLVTESGCEVLSSCPKRPRPFM